MSTQRPSVASPLKDRLLSNSPDPVQSSIRRDSAKGWGKSSSPGSGSGTTPLRIAKREGKPPFPPVARRSSSSYKHVRNSNLVSKSPFKVQAPTPSRPSSSSETPSTQPGTRRVSGEKRPRPDSMHEQAENERPLAFKRERRQSKAYQGLIEKEPVTKSPFKRVTSGEEEFVEEPPPPLPPKAALTPAAVPPLPPAPPSPPLAQAPPSRPVTPSRSALVSKRLHGPRTVDHPSLEGKRQRRKTVTFDERCDVLEFDRDEEEEENPFFSSDEDDYGQPEQAAEIEAFRAQLQDFAVSPDHAEDSFESAQFGEGDVSLTGVVDNMIQTASMPGLGLPSTPSRSLSLPADLETEDGVPYGRSHHAERSRRRASVSSPMSVPGFPFPSSSPSGQEPEHDSPSTPPRAADSYMEISSAEGPLCGSTHAERAQEDNQPNEAEEDVDMMPPSPSPAKTVVRNEHSNRDSLIPRFELPTPQSESSPKNVNNELPAESPTGDPFSAPIPRIKEEGGELSFTSFEDPLDPGNLSIGQSEVSLSNLDLEAELQKVLNPTQDEQKDGVPRLSDLIPRSSSFTTSTPPRPIPPLSFAGVSSSPSQVPIDERSMELEASPAPHILHIPDAPGGRDILNSVSPSGISLPRSSSSGSPAALNMRRRSDSPLNLNIPSRLTSISPALRSASPTVRTGSPLRESASVQELQGGRMPRISREDVQMRLMRKRSTESPMGSPAPGSPVITPATSPPERVGVEEKVTEEQSERVEADEVEAAPTPEVEEVEEDRERENRRPDNMSVMTDVSAEFATIQTAEKRTLNSATVSAENSLSKLDEDVAMGEDEDVSPAAPVESPPSRPLPQRPHSSYGMLETSFDRSGLGLGFRDSMGSLQLGEMRSALDRLMDDVKGSAGSSTKQTNSRSQVRVELMTEGIKAGQFGANLSGATGDSSMRTDTDIDMDVSMSMDDTHPMLHPARVAPLPIQRSATDSVVYSGPQFRSPVDVDVDEMAVPMSPTKDAIKKREELILEKRREARRREEDESLGYYTPPRPTSLPPSEGRPSRRRSRSTGDAGALTKSELLLDIGISETAEELLAESISKELRRLDPEHRGKYRVREHEAIFASADAEQVSHTSFAGDVNGGKAWKAVRRPSDMNEYAKQIREYRSQEKPGKSSGKVFVRVVGVKGLKVPIPQQATALTCTLNNGIHFVTTPETRLAQDTRIDQEFELIEHNKLEFTLTLKIKTEPHIAAQFKALVPPKPAPEPKPVAPPPKPKGGMFSFFSSSPKKPAARPTPPPPAPPPHKLPDNLARYLKQDGTLARAFISFKDVASRCDTRVFEVSYPLIGQRSESSGNATTMELGEIVLQLFRLPSLPGVLSNQLPLSMDECLRGLRHVAWHKVTYFEGTLTQNGGDCTTWRRRTFRVTGASLIAFNDVTKKATATINLAKAVAVEDIQNTSDGRYRDDYDSQFAVERSFKLVFRDDQHIFFFADSDEEKARWLEVLHALVGHIPPNPLWAELVWQRQQELSKSSSAST